MKNINTKADIKTADDNIIRLMQLSENDIEFLSGKGGSINCAVISSGCKLNQFESSQFEEIFKRMNINVVDFRGSDGNIDLFLVNTCTVTEKADTETDKIIRKIRKKYPHSRLLLTGCSAQLNKIKFSGIPGIKLMDNIQKTEVLKISSQRFPDIALNQKKNEALFKNTGGMRFGMFLLYNS